MKTSSHTDVYQIITDLIIEKLESGTIPWKQPWSDYGPACNYLVEKALSRHQSTDPGRAA
jgi:antirestriction protein ArdC